jgi:hypothetical protein
MLRKMKRENKILTMDEFLKLQSPQYPSEEPFVHDASLFFRSLGRILYYEKEKILVPDPMIMIEKLFRPLVQAAGRGDQRHRCGPEEEKNWKLFLKTLESFPGVVGENIKHGIFPKKEMVIQLWKVETGLGELYLNILSQLHYLAVTEESSVIIPSLLREKSTLQRFKESIVIFAEYDWLPPHLFSSLLTMVLGAGVKTKEGGSHLFANAAQFTFNGEMFQLRSEKNRIYLEQNFLSTTQSLDSLHRFVKLLFSNVPEANLRVPCDCNESELTVGFEFSKVKSDKKLFCVNQACSTEQLPRVWLHLRDSAGESSSIINDGGSSLTLTDAESYSLSRLLPASDKPLGDDLPRLIAIALQQRSQQSNFSAHEIWFAIAATFLKGYFLEKDFLTEGKFDFQVFVSQMEFKGYNLKLLAQDLAKHGDAQSEALKRLKLAHLTSTVV